MIRISLYLAFYCVALLGVIAVRKPQDLFVHVGVGGGRLHLVVAGVGPRVPYVVPGGAKTLPK